jgi:hypothetical protein
MRDLRRVVSTAVIVCFSFAALMGIVALLSGGAFGEGEVRVLLTTTIVGTESIAVLCYLSVARNRLAAVGAVGGLTSLVPFGLALAFTWGVTDADGVWKTFGVGLTLAASLAQACLLIALDARRETGAALPATLVAIAVVAAMVSWLILGEAGSDGYGRALGVVGILDVLGTVVVSAMGAFRRTPSARLLDEDVETRLLRVAAERGTSPSRLVTEALDAYLTPR